MKELLAVLDWQSTQFPKCMWQLSSLKEVQVWYSYSFVINAAVHTCVAFVHGLEKVSLDDKCAMSNCLVALDAAV